MKFFYAYKKWYLKFLTLLAVTGAIFVFFYIVGCKDLSFIAQNNVDCSEIIGPTEESACEEEEGFGTVGPTPEEEDGPCGSGAEAGNGCFDVGGGDGNPEGGGSGRAGDDDGGRGRDGTRSRDRDGEGRGRDRTRSRDDDDDRSRSRSRSRDDEDEFSGSRKPWIRIRTTVGRIDILFIVDNSQSMKEELASIAHQFDPFLESIEDYDYHIALTTTDWVQDRGQFLVFENNQKFLSNPERARSTHRENVALFQKLVQMPASTTSHERGIYVLNMVLDNMGQSSFFRPHSLFMVIIVSDEDENSFGGRVPEGKIGTVPPLENYDLPETFFRKVSQQHKFSIVSTHAIIMPPDGADCPDQCKANGKCVEGRIYADLARPSKDLLRQYGNIRKGHIGSICDTNFSSQLGPIANALQESPPIPLPCFPKRRVYARVNDENVLFRVEGKKIILAEQVHFGADVEVKFRCR